MVIKYSNSPWLYMGKEITPEEVRKYEAFVYVIIHKSTKEFYIGKKWLTSIRKNKKTNKRVKSEADWQNYLSSSVELKHRIAEEGIENWERHILSLHSKRSESNYYEVWHQFNLDALYNPKCLNENIAAKWFRKNTIRYEKIFNTEIINTIKNSSKEI